MAQMWIANRETAARDGRVLEVRNPATEETIDAVPRASAADVDAAVAAAARAFSEWRKTPGIEMLALPALAISPLEKTTSSAFQ